MGKNVAINFFGWSFWVGYNLLSLLFSPILLVALLLMGRRMGNWHHRLGRYPGISLQRADVWIHMVSVGEARAGLPLVKKLQKQSPDLRLLLSSYTPAGVEFLQREVGGTTCIIYAPLDFLFCMLPFYLRFRPKVVVLVETEIWPNLVVLAKLLSFRLLLANGRISDQMYHSRIFLHLFWRFLFSFFHAVFMRGPLDAQRIRNWMANDNRIFVTGDMKTELDLEEIKKKADTLLELFPQLKGKLIFTAGSTHEGEEEILLNVWKNLAKPAEAYAFILAPRHSERAKALASYCTYKGWAVSLRSCPPPKDQHFDVLILDGVGELVGAYYLADVVFVGGSLVQRGGHNPMEPAQVGKPVLFGFSMENFRDSAQQLLRSEGARQVTSASELQAVLSELLSHSEKRVKMGITAQKTFAFPTSPSQEIADFVRKYFQ